LTLACMIYMALVWAADRTPPPYPPPQAGEGLKICPPPLAGEGREGAAWRAVQRRLRWSACALLVLAIAQVYLGALVAGLRAGLIFNTWPLIDGRFIPSTADLFFAHPLWRNFFENTLTVQFDHRMVAYGLCAFALFHAVDARRHARGEPVATG